MSKFLEITIKDEQHLININNIALIKQINANITEIHLFSKVENVPLTFQISVNYGYFRNFLNEKDKLINQASFLDYK